MTVAVVVVVVLAVGLPLLAWWWGGRPFWARSDERARRQIDVRQDVRRRHGLSSAEATAVEQAVQGGRALDHERLRAAAVDWAELLLGQMRSRGGLPGGAPGFFVVLGGGYLVASIAVIAYSLATGQGMRWSVVLFTANGVFALSIPVLIRRKLERVITRNGGSLET